MQAIFSFRQDYPHTNTTGNPFNDCLPFNPINVNSQYCYPGYLCLTILSLQTPLLHIFRSPSSIVLAFDIFIMSCGMFYRQGMFSQDYTNPKNAHFSLIWTKIHCTYFVSMKVENSLSLQMCPVLDAVSLTQKEPGLLIPWKKQSFLDIPAG